MFGQRLLPFSHEVAFETVRVGSEAPAALIVTYNCCPDLGSSSVTKFLGYRGSACR